jgi:hypothetical protein
LVIASDSSRDGKLIETSTIAEIAPWSRSLASSNPLASVWFSGSGIIETTGSQPLIGG